MNKIKIIPFIAISGVVVFLCGLFFAGLLLQNPNAGRKFSAWMLGAEFVDTAFVVMQTKDNNCGPSALKMIFDHYRIFSTVEEIEKNAGLNEKGSSMLALKEMAAVKGLHAEGWKLSLDDFANKQFPVLMFVHNDHFVVADSVVNNVVFIRDPAIGRLKIHKSRLVNIWKGETLVFKLVF
ncbi:MAG: cysteine peptidase family C39 domain-containing protein [Bacteroidota bacterium]